MSGGRRLPRDGSTLRTSIRRPRPAGVVSHATGYAGGIRSRVWPEHSHYFVFAAIAALGAGLQVAIDATHEAVELTPTGVALNVAIPVIVYTVAMGLLHRLTASWRFMTPFAVVAVVVVGIAAGAAWFGVPAAILLMALVLAGFVAWMVASMTRPAVAEH